MADWKKVTQADGKAIWLNMSLATAMVPGPQPGTTVVVFDKDNKRTVRESPDKIRQSQK